ncbi:MAG: glycoside hydrolase family 3 protein [Clostridia bacterium]
MKREMKTNKNKMNKPAIFLAFAFITAIVSSCSIYEGDIGIPSTLPSGTSQATQTAPQESEPANIEKKLYSVMTEEEIQNEINMLIESMTILEKASQMLQAERAAVSVAELRSYPLGSILSGGGSAPGDGTKEDWKKHISSLQTSIMAKDPRIPLLYGIDAVHGNDHVENPVIFPHNIGLGAANDEMAMAEYGKVVAEEMKATYVNWNFAPCIAVALDPRWGRTYESFSSDGGLVARLSLPFMSALQENGIAATAKHYIGDGGTLFGTGQGDYDIDRGDAQMTEEMLRELFMEPYEVLVSSGVYTVMVSFSSFNGLKMHQNEYLINDVLKGELGFKGFVISDWEGHHEIDSDDYDTRIAIAVNSGIDMLMEPFEWEKSIYSIVKGYENGTIAMERIDDAVGRILWVKMKSGVFDMVYDEWEFEIGSDENRRIARELVEKSAVLLKNNKGLLPLKEGTKVFITGPAADNIGVQCGGWTIEWQGKLDEKGIEIAEGTTLLEGLSELASDMKIEIITDEDKISEADVVILAIGEKPYAEGFGDSSSLSIVSDHALDGNYSAIQFAKTSGKPVITVIYAGRNVMITEFIDDWDSVLMAYLPGTEGLGTANLLTGKADFTAKLPMPWYREVGEIGKDKPELLFEINYGLSYR